MDHNNIPAIPAPPPLPSIEERLARLDEEERIRHADIRLEISIDWDWDEARGKLLDNRTGLDLLVDGEPNPAIPDAPDREGYVQPDWYEEATE